jgi:signal transduction histidine kinase
MSEDSKQIKKGTFKFRPRARLLNILGHELITDEVIAIIELVKNSYDADATRVTITLDNITKKSGGKIEVRDDGHGMTLETIETSWMEPARDNKSDKKGKRPRTIKFNRLPLGEKGVGRFSVDKLGLKLELISRFCKFDKITKKVSYLSDEESVLVIEGNKFTKDTYLDEIECAWKTRKPEEFQGEDHGLLLRITNLRNPWSDELIEKMRFGVARLSSPFSEAQDFEIIINSNEFPELSAKVENPLLKIAPWILDATFDENGIMYYKMQSNEKTRDGKEDLRIGSDRFLIKDVKKGELRKPICGPFKMKLYAFERERKLQKKYHMDKEKIELLNNISGVSIYRDNFRIFPYGESGNDWLTFDKRRIQNPGKILGNDRVIGYVEISQITNPYLKDKTNREGLIEDGEAFPDLRELAINAADFLGLFRYNSIEHKPRSKVKVEEGKEDVEKGSQIVQDSSVKTKNELINARKNIDEGKSENAKNALEKAGDFAEKSGKATEQIRAGYKKLMEEIAVSDEQINNLISLSGIGMTAERMTHEFSKAARNSKDLLNKSIKYLESGKVDIITLKKKLQSVTLQLEIILDLVKQMEPLYYSRRRFKEKIDVGNIARNMEMFYSNTISNLGIKLEIIEDSKLSVEMGKGHLLQIFNNLFDNSFFWLEHARPTGQLRIRIQISNKNRSIIFADNGPGVKDYLKNHLFEPFVSTKPDGRGLGLFIISDILQNYNAEIELLEQDKILEGANFKITFPRE